MIGRPRYLRIPCYCVGCHSPSDKPLAKRQAKRRETRLWKREATA